MFGRWEASLRRSLNRCHEALDAGKVDAALREHQEASGKYVRWIAYHPTAAQLQAMHILLDTCRTRLIKAGKREEEVGERYAGRPVPVTSAVALAREVMDRVEGSATSAKESSRDPGRPPPG